MKRLRDTDNAWALALANVAGHAKRMPRNAPHPKDEGKFLRALDVAYQPLWEIMFTRICKRVYIERRQGGLLPIGDDGKQAYVKDQEAEIAGDLAREFATLAKAAFLHAFLAKDVREFIVQSAISGRQRKVRSGSANKTTIAIREYKSRYPELSVNDRLSKMERDGVIRRAGAGWELVATGDQLPKAIYSAFSRA